MRYFVTGTGTDVGKTYITSLLMKQNSWTAYKPICCGSDDDKILQCNSLYKLEAPLSPPQAAKLENIKLDFRSMVEACKASGGDLIEGAGGIMSPLTENKTNLDLATALNIPVLLVAGNYVGTITHTLTALKTLEKFDVKVILNDYAQSICKIEDVAAEIQSFSGHKPVLVKYRQQNCDIK